MPLSWLQALILVSFLPVAFSFHPTPHVDVSITGSLAQTRLLSELTLTNVVGRHHDPASSKRRNYAAMEAAARGTPTVRHAAWQYCSGRGGWRRRAIAWYDVATALRGTAPSSSSSSTDVSLHQSSGSAEQGSLAPPAATLGVRHSLLDPTIVAGLSGAVLKQSPADFVVVEEPLFGGTRFTPADPSEPLPEHARKSRVPEIPPTAVVEAAVEEWRSRWPEPFDGGDTLPEEEEEQAAWVLAKGFDSIGEWLGGPATVQLQDWMVQIAVRAAFDIAEAEAVEKDASFTGSLLPPTAPENEVLLPCPDHLDKAGRTAVHEKVREFLPYFSTRAIMPGTGTGRGASGANAGRSKDGTTYMELAHFSTRRGGRESWPKGRGEYLEFSVYKAGRSTNEVADALCRRLKIQRGRLSYAGAKDRRAITAQKMRCWRLYAEELHEAQASGALEEEGLAVSDYRYAPGDFKLGDLKGNHFEVLLRPPPGGWGTGGRGGASAGEAFRRIRDGGFINFFGSQRFGRDGTNSVDVGMLLLNSNWEGAVRRILAPHPADTAEVSAAKQAFFSGEREGRQSDGARAALRLLPRSAFLERNLLYAVAETDGRDMLGALLELPRPLRLLFVQSYQSLLWNEAASLRMGGWFDRTKAVEGDLVLVSETRALTAWDTRPLAAGDGNQGTQAGRGARRGRGRARGRGAGGRGAAGGGVEVQRAIRVGADEARRGVFGIEHVVIPLPGRSVEFPSHSVGENMLRSLQRDGVAEVIIRGHHQRSFDLDGAYRHVVVHPRDLTVQPVPPDSKENIELPATTSIEDIGEENVGQRGGMLPAATAAWLRARFKDEVARRFRGATEDTTTEKGTGRRAGKADTPIRVSFSLPVSSYATTLLQHLTGHGLGGDLSEAAGARKGEEEGEFEDFAVDYSANEEQGDEDRSF